MQEQTSARPHAIAATIAKPLESKKYGTREFSDVAKLTLMTFFKRPTGASLEPNSLRWPQLEKPTASCCPHTIESCFVITLEPLAGHDLKSND